MTPAITPHNTLQAARDAAQHPIPDNPREFIDKYFLRARTILEAEGLNPHVTMQVFIRHGPGNVYGVDEAVNLLREVGGLTPDTHEVWALPEGSRFDSEETLMLIKGPVQQFVELETLYLGVLTARTTEAIDGADFDFEEMRRTAEGIRELMPDKQLIYFGSRHWHWSLDKTITKAVVGTGFDGSSTDAGALAAGLPYGVGTIPHALVLVFGHKVGREHATAESVAAFDRHIPEQVPRIALVDTFNREIDDSLDCARRLGDRLHGVRVDTAGEVIGQGGVPFDGREHWTGQGVTVESVRAVRQALDDNGFENVNIVVSSGFGSLDKVHAFLEGEKKYGRLFDSIGIGGLYHARYATADIVQVQGRHMAKTGRELHENPRLERMI